MKKNPLGEDLPINSPKEFELSQRFEPQILEPTDTYTLPEIAEKLVGGIELNEIERQMASATILDWIRLRESRKHGRPKKWNSAKEKNKYYNDKRRGKLDEN
jgi:hypothetical protein